jgi:hypothetical protein
MEPDCVITKPILEVLELSKTLLCIEIEEKTLAEDNIQSGQALQVPSDSPRIGSDFASAKGGSTRAK